MKPIPAIQIIAAVAALAIPTADAAKPAPEGAPRETRSRKT